MGLFGSEPKLKGKRIAILATEGVEQVELTKPRKALEKAGAQTQLISPSSHIKGGKIKAWNLTKWGDSFKVDITLTQAVAGQYDALLLPGGVMNPDFLRMDPEAVPVRPQFCGGREAHRLHLPWPLDADRGRSGCRSNDDLVAVTQDRSQQRRSQLGR